MPNPPHEGKWLSGLFATLAFFAFLFQTSHNAYVSDLGADPDEPAHAVTALMTRDYLVHGLLHGVNPMRFAQEYYEHFPKVALGHYPPGFYVVAGLCLLVWNGKTSLLILLALLSGACGTATAAFGRRLGLSRLAGLVAGAWFVALPLTQIQTMFVMSDLQVVLGFLMATLAFSKFMDAPTARHSLIFGAWAAATMLTKASGAALAFLPLLAIALRCDWRLLWNWRLWLAPLPVILTAIPWTLATYHLTKDGMVDTPLPVYFMEALHFYTSSLPDAVSWIALAGALVAVILCVKNRRKPSPAAASLVAMFAGIFVLYLVVRSGMDRRYLLPLASPLILATCWTLEQLFSARWKSAACVIAALAGCFSVTQPNAKSVTGFSEAAAFLVQKAPTGGNILVSSDARGEGAFIAELAFATDDRLHSPWRIVRSSKFLASSDWVGRSYHARFENAEALRDGLANDDITWVLDDMGIPDDYVLLHHRQLHEWLGSEAPRPFTEVARMSSMRATKTEPHFIVLRHVEK